MRRICCAERVGCGCDWTGVVRADTSAACFEVELSGVLPRADLESLFGTGIGCFRTLPSAGASTFIDTGVVLGTLGSSVFWTDEVLLLMEDSFDKISVLIAGSVTTFCGVDVGTPVVEGVVPLLLDAIGTVVAVTIPRRALLAVTACSRRIVSNRAKLINVDLLITVPQISYGIMHKTFVQCHR